MSRMISAGVAFVLVFAALAGARLLSPTPALAASGVLSVPSPLHDGPDPAAAVITLLPEGTEVSIDGPPIAGFYPVSADGLSGWMRGETLLLTKDVPVDYSLDVPPAETNELEPIAPTATPDATPGAVALQEEGAVAAAGDTAPTDPAAVSAAAPVEPATDAAGNSSDAAAPATADPAPQPPVEAMPTESETAALAATPAAASPATEVPPSDAAAPEPEPAPAETTTAGPVSETGPQGPASVTVDAPIRTGPGPAYDLIFTVPQGSTIEETGNVVDGYVTVRYKEVTGWLALSDLAPPSDFIPENPPEATAAPVETKMPRPGSGVAYTTVDLSLRNGPSATAPPVAAVPAGSRVVLTGVMEGGFQRVTFRDQIGWIADDFLQTPPNPDDARGARTENYSRREIVRIIYAAADHYGQSREDMLRVAQCESNLDPYAVNPSGSYGLFQFIRTTWKSTPFGGEDVFDPRANANAAGWMWAQGRKSEWVCQ